MILKVSTGKNISQKNHRYGWFFLNLIAGNKSNILISLTQVENQEYFLLTSYDN